jgi:hypothetical protein
VTWSGEIAGRFGQGPLHRHLAQRPQVGQAHAVGAEHAGERVDHHLGHAQGVGHQAGVLASRSAETGQDIFGDVVAALDRDLPHRLGHVLHGDGHEALGDLLRGHGLAGRGLDLVRHRLEAGHDDVAVQALVGVRAEHRREEVGRQLAQHHVAVGHRQRSAAPVAGRAGICPGRRRSHTEPRAVERTDRAATGRHGVDVHHRRTHPHACHHGLVGSLVLTGEMADVGRGAAHVEADHPLEPGLGGGLGHAHHAAGRTGQDGVLAPEGVGVGQAAVRLHEQQPRLAAPHSSLERVRHLVDIAAQDRRQVGVDDRGVAAPDQLHQRADLMADRHLGEADLAGDRRHPRLVVGEAKAVQQHDGHGAEALVEDLLETGASGCLVQRTQHRPLDADPLVDLDHAGVKGLGLDDVAVEQLGPGLVADAQGVGMALGDRQDGRLAGPLEQRVGGDGGAHLDRVDGGLAFQQGSHAGHRRVVILLGILGQQLMGQQAPVRPPRDDVGEGAAAVDPELPAAVGHQGPLSWGLFWR